MDQDPSELRSQVEETRSRVGDEVDALSYKTDVGARVGDYVGEKKEAVASRLERGQGRRDEADPRSRAAAAGYASRPSATRSGSQSAQPESGFDDRVASPDDPPRGREARSGL